MQPLPGECNQRVKDCNLAQESTRTPVHAHEHLYNAASQDSHFCPREMSLQSQGRSCLLTIRRIYSLLSVVNIM